MEEIIPRAPGLFYLGNQSFYCLVILREPIFQKSPKEIDEPVCAEVVQDKMRGVVGVMK
jgi:hypothetical protein